MFDWLRKSSQESKTDHKERLPEPEFRPAKLPPRRPEQPPPTDIERVVAAAKELVGAATGEDSSSPRTAQTFYAAPFACNGEFLGIGEWQVSALSDRWLDLSRKILRDGGSVFNTLMPAPFERVALRFTSASGAALTTFSLDGLPVASSAWLRGDVPAVDKELLEMYVDSLRRVEIVRQSQTTCQPFAEAFNISQRPLHVVVAWGISAKEDSEMIAQLGNHFAAAFLLQQDAV